MHGQDGVAGVDRADEGYSWSVFGPVTCQSTSSGRSRTILALDAGDVGNLLHVQESSHAGQETLAESGVPGDDVGVFALLDVLDEEGGVVLREALYEQKKHPH